MLKMANKPLLLFYYYVTAGSRGGPRQEPLAVWKRAREERMSIGVIDPTRRRQSAAARLPRLRREEEVLFDLVEAGDLDGIMELLQVGKLGCEGILKNGRS